MVVCKQTPRKIVQLDDRPNENVTSDFRFTSATAWLLTIYSQILSVPSFSVKEAEKSKQTNKQTN